MAIVQEIKGLTVEICGKAGLIGGTLGEVKSALKEANQSLSPFVEDVGSPEQTMENAQEGETL